MQVHIENVVVIVGNPECHFLFRLKMLHLIVECPEEMCLQSVAAQTAVTIV